MFITESMGCLAHIYKLLTASGVNASQDQLRLHQLIADKVFTNYIPNNSNFGYPYIIINQVFAQDVLGNGGLIVWNLSTYDVKIYGNPKNDYTAMAEIAYLVSKILHRTVSIQENISIDSCVRNSTLNYHVKDGDLYIPVFSQTYKLIANNLDCESV